MAGKFEEDDGVKSSFAELPVQAAVMRWTRGDARLVAVKDVDPGQYFGGWKARVKKFGTTNDEFNPPLPYPIVTRTNEKGNASFEVFATNILHIVTVATRNRFELRSKAMNQALGFETTKVERVSLERKEGYQPMQQVFGLAFNPLTDEHYPVVLWIDAWSASISFNKASQVWKKTLKAIPEGTTLIRRYGSVGRMDKASGLLVPDFEEFGGGRSTPIMAIDVANPRYFKITDELTKLQEDAQEWKTCPRWHQEGKFGGGQDEAVVVGEEPINEWLVRLDARAKELHLTNLDIQDIVKHEGGDYKKAFMSIADSSQLEAGGTAEINPFDVPA